MIAEYVYFGLRPVAVKNGSNINIVHTDYLTTPRIVTSGGSIVWQWRNDNPYGNNLAQGNIEFNLRFAGQYYDAESGLHYNIHRTYNPEIGRYMQSDPLGLSAGSNTYNYVGRNPFDAVDPLGLIKYNFNDDPRSSHINEAYEHDYNPSGYIETYGHAYDDGLSTGIIVGLNSPAMLELKTIDKNLYNVFSNYKRCEFSDVCSPTSIEINGFAFAKILKTLNKGQKNPEKIILHQCQIASVSNIDMVKNEFKDSIIYASPYVNYMGYYENNPYGESNKTYSLGSWTGTQKELDELKTTTERMKSPKFLPGSSGFKIF